MSKRKAAFPIIDLVCGGGGALVVEKVIKQVPGVLDVYVNPATATAYVEYVAEGSPKRLLRRRFAELVTRRPCQRGPCG